MSVYVFPWRTGFAPLKQKDSNTSRKTKMLNRFRTCQRTINAVTWQNYVGYCKRRPIDFRGYAVEARAYNKLCLKDLAGTGSICSACSINR
jgi:hypothetical protein